MKCFDHHSALDRALAIARARAAEVPVFIDYTVTTAWGAPLFYVDSAPATATLHVYVSPERALRYPESSAA